MEFFYILILNMSQNRIGEHYNRYTKTNYTEYNGQQFTQNDVNNVYDKTYNTKYSISQEPEIEYEETIQYLSVSSRDRNFTQYPNVNSYTVEFITEFKNISAIELVQAIIPAKNNVEEEPYLLLEIDEISDVMFSKDRYITDSFAMLQLAAPTTTGGFIQIDKRIHENTVKYFKIPKASLSKMTITLRDCTGNKFNFGTDSNPPQKALQNTFIFKITTLEKKRKQMDHRNVF